MNISIENTTKETLYIHRQVNEIDGEAFLRHAGKREFFQGAGIAYAPSDNLTSLAKVENPTSKFYLINLINTTQTASR
jgi:hypothetical protein